MSVATGVRHHLALGTVLSPLRNWVRQVLADYPLEGLSVLWAIEAAKDIVDGTVLESVHGNMA
jgi:hypothetical protein